MNYCNFIPHRLNNQAIIIRDLHVHSKFLLISNMKLDLNLKLFKHTQNPK